MTYSNKVCWITGASSGIGEALSYIIASKGGILILSARRIDKLEEVAKQCRSLGAAQVVLIALDLEQGESIEAGYQSFIKKFKSIDFLINVGGISQRGYVQDTRLDVDRRIMEINFFGTVHLTKLVLPLMLEQGRGNISFTSSLVGKFGFPLRSSYSASKHALEGFFESLRTEVDSLGVKVSNIVPGRVKTEISLHALSADGREHGKMDDGQNKGISSTKAAQIIAKGLARNKREIAVGGAELLMIQIKRFIPALFYKIVARIKHT